MLKFKVINHAQGSPEWLAYRREHITASNVAAIMGQSPWSTPLQVYNEMVGGETKAANPAMRRGTELEPLAREWVEKELNIQVKNPTAESIEFPWAAASLDGIDMVTDLVVEIKCPGNENHLMSLGGFVPEQYNLQIQWQLFVTQAPRAIYVSFDGEKGVVIPVSRDEVLIKECFEACKKFYEEHFLAKVPPAPMPKDRIYDPQFESHEDRVVDLLEKRDQIKDLLHQVEYEIDLEKTQLEEIAGERARVCGNQILLTKVTKTGSIDYHKAWLSEGNRAVDLSKYRKPETVYTQIRRYSGDS